MKQGCDQISLCNLNFSLLALQAPTWSSIHGLDLLPRLQVPEADVSVQGAGGSDGAVVTDVHGDHAQLVTLQRPLQLQLLVRPAGRRHSGVTSQRQNTEGLNIACVCQ